MSRWQINYLSIWFNISSRDFIGPGTSLSIKFWALLWCFPWISPQTQTLNQLVIPGYSCHYYTTEHIWENGLIVLHPVHASTVNASQQERQFSPCLCLVSTCPISRICGVFKSRVFLSSSGGLPSAIAVRILFWKPLVALRHPILVTRILNWSI